MPNQRWTKLSPTISFIIFYLLIGGCYATNPYLQQEVTTEYLLQQAGFQVWEVNEKTPKRAALLNYLPEGKVSTYIRDGVVLHAYPDNNAHKIYIGDAAAYQRYLSSSQGRQICQKVTGDNNVQFWSCMDDYQQGKVK